ncbi:MAG: DUF1080 domain-containing protein [Kiritimatiellia bacterium]|jgi:hypothetical protein|nr:DUF1080 domain-containing protein [Kiritimatiellia bacterium]MDP6848764.1 DUF1080 domain-containing protein [Kiritimatiellia bacterium]
MGKILVLTILLLAAFSCVEAADSVGIDKLDAVFLNFDKDSEGWAGVSMDGGKQAAANLPKLVKMEKGTVKGSSRGAAGGEGPDKAFDGSAATKYCVKSRTMWVHYQFAAGKKKVETYSITTANDAPERDPRDWKLLGSNDDDQWDVLDEKAGEKWSKRFERREFRIAKPGEYAYFKLDITKNHGEDTCQIAELELLTAEDLEKKKETETRDKPSKKTVLKKIKRKGPATAHPDVKGWKPLFSEDLSNADFPKGVWTVSNGEFTASKDQALWTNKDYENFILDLEFKTDNGSNSGVLAYVTDTRKWIPNSVEIQITDDFAKKWASANPTWRCGAIFGRLAASKSMVKKPGEWNRFTITCEGPFIDVVLNGEHVTAMDMRRWDSAKKNPDGSNKPGWLNKPLSKHPTRGKIGLQGKHAGAPIWFRNIKIKEL